MSLAFGLPLCQRPSEHAATLSSIRALCAAALTMRGARRRIEPRAKPEQVMVDGNAPNKYGGVDARLVERVIAEYREMPGLALTLPQAVRMWGCDERTCQQVVSALVDMGVLRRSRHGRFVRSDISDRP